MDKYICLICGYVYDPENGDSSQGIEPGTSFQQLPETWKCPVCKVEKGQFKKQ